MTSHSWKGMRVPAWLVEKKRDKNEGLSWQVGGLSNLVKVECTGKCIFSEKRRVQPSFAKWRLRNGSKTAFWK